MGRAAWAGRRARAGGHERRRGGVRRACAGRRGRGRSGWSRSGRTREVDLGPEPLALLEVALAQVEQEQPPLAALDRVEAEQQRALGVPRVARVAQVLEPASLVRLGGRSTPQAPPPSAGGWRPRRSLLYWALSGTAARQSAEPRPEPTLASPRRPGGVASSGATQATLSLQRRHVLARFVLGERAQRGARAAPYVALLPPLRLDVPVQAALARLLDAEAQLE